MCHETSFVPAPDRTSTLVPAADPRESPPDLDALGETIAAVAARLHAATYELLVLLRRFDAWRGWSNGFLSCAHWLSWRTGLDPGAAREKVRVAHALADLPLISAAMARGELSYAKVRALTRIATAAQEPTLLDVARAATAAQLERIVRAWRRADRSEAARLNERRQQQRSVTLWVEEDGMVTLRGRLTPEAGAVVQRALDAAADRLWRDPRTPADQPPEAQVTAARLRADALVLLAECALNGDLDPGHTGDRYQVVVHVDSATLSAPADVDSTGQAAVEVGHGAAYVAAETAQRIACDASLVVMQHGPDGSVLDVGRKRRIAPAAIRRALASRDRHCQFPGCLHRRCDVHHLVAWAQGGRTSLANSMLLCRHHHRAVHEGGLRITRAPDGEVAVRWPDGRRLNTAPPPLPSERWSKAPASKIQCPPSPQGRDGQLDLVWAIDVLRVRCGTLEDA